MPTRGSVLSVGAQKANSTFVRAPGNASVKEQERFHPFGTVRVAEAVVVHVQRQQVVNNNRCP
jgi:hypothetical protein